MPVTQLGNETTTVYADGADFVMERVFAAPRELVWQALTEPRHIPNWWGPRDVPMTVEAMDFRVGGRWRWIAQGEDGEAPFSGEYLEIDPPAKIVSTEGYDNMPGARYGVTVTLDEADGVTTLRSHLQYPSQEFRDGHVASGMEHGMNISYNRLEALLDRLR